MGQPGGEKQLLSRRDALQALAAAGGAVALATLPNRGEKPLVRVGTLLAHTQASPVATTYAYLTNSNGDTVAVINTATNTVVATIGVGNGPLRFGLVYWPCAGVMDLLPGLCPPRGESLHQMQGPSPEGLFLLGRGMTPLGSIHERRRFSRV